MATRDVSLFISFRRLCVFLPPCVVGVFVVALVAVGAVVGVVVVVVAMVVCVPAFVVCVAAVVVVTKVRKCTHQYKMSLQIFPSLSLSLSLPLFLLFKNR